MNHTNDSRPQIYSPMSRMSQNGCHLIFRTVVADSLAPYGTVPSTVRGYDQGPSTHYSFSGARPGPSDVDT